MRMKYREVTKLEVWDEGGSILSNFISLKKIDCYSSKLGTESPRVKNITYSPLKCRGLYSLAPHSTKVNDVNELLGQYDDI
jgi:hypothetical protein